MAECINGENRESYEAPTIEDVPLRADERVLGGCKSTGGPSPGREGANFDCTVCKQATPS